MTRNIQRLEGTELLTENKCEDMEHIHSYNNMGN